MKGRGGGGRGEEEGSEVVVVWVQLISECSAVLGVWPGARAVLDAAISPLRCPVWEKRGGGGKIGHKHTWRGLVRREPGEPGKVEGSTTFICYSYSLQQVAPVVCRWSTCTSPVPHCTMYRGHVGG